MNTLLKTGGGLLITALVAGFSATPMRAQNPPVKMWQWSAPYNSNQYPYANVENWLYPVLSVNDGGHVAAGWAYRAPEYNIWPSVVKVDANGNELWATMIEQTSATHSGGRAFDIVEVSDGYVIAYQSGGTVMQAVGIVKVNKNTGAVMAGFPKWWDATNLTSYPANESPVAQSIEVINSAGVAQGYIIGGNSQSTPYTGFEGSMRGAFLMRLDMNFNLVGTFGTSGYTIKQRGWAGMTPATEKSSVFDVKVLYDNNNPATGLPVGIIGIGHCISSAGPNDRDMLVLRTSMTGTTTWIKTYSENQPTTSDHALSSFGYVDVGAPEFRVCQTAVSTETDNHERGSTILQYSPTTGTNEAVVLGLCDFSWNFGTTGWDCHFNPMVQDAGYLDNDMAMFRINLSTGLPQSTAPAPKNVARFTGIDYQPRMVMDATSIYVSGQDGSTDMSYITNDVVKMNRTTFAQTWRYKPLVTSQNTVACTFGACLTQDGGLVLCGNNELNGEDGFILKLGSDCGTNLTGLTNTTGAVISTSTTWNTNKNIRGVVRIQNGATLTINGTALIKFADTRSYNDFDYLANNNFNYTSTLPRNTQPTKIIIEKGGTLVLGGTARLTGYGTCSDMWEGIEAWGDPALVQSATTQGRMLATGGTAVVVEKMYGGMACDWNNYNPQGRIEHSGTNWANKGGGYIQMSNGSLLNNRYGVYMAPYERISTNFPFNPLANATYFTGTTFMQNAHLPDITFVDAQGNRVGTDKFYEAVQCSRVNFTNTRFKGYLSLLRQYRGYGIRSKDSEVYVTTNTTLPAFNFEDLSIGVFGSHAVRRMNIEKNRFKNCDLGILQNGGGSGAQFNNNIMNVPLGVSTTHYTCGIRVNGNVNANITSNLITGMGTGVLTDLNRGIYVQDLGTWASMVGYNTFDKLRIGFQPAGINGTSGTIASGLAARCNTMTAANYYDWAVNVTATGVFPKQGQGCNPQLQAGNKFNDATGCGTPAAENILSGVSFTYVGSATAANEIPQCNSATVTITGCNPGNASNCTGSNLVCNTSACNQVNITAMNAETDAQLKDLLRNRIVDYYLAVDSPDKAVSQLVLWNTSNSKRTLVPVYLRMRQWGNAQTALNAIGTGNAEDAAFTSVYQTMIDIGNAGANILTFTVAQKGSLDLVAKGSTSMRHTAQGLLNAAIGTPITLVWEEPTGGSGGSVVKNVEASTFGNMVAMPNPFDGSTIISCPLPEKALDIRVLLTDLEGRLVEDRRVPGGMKDLRETISGEGRANGVYLCTVIADGAVVGIVRVVIQH